MQDDAQELLRLSHRLLDAIDRGDWDTYAELCDPSLTAFEPEAGGHLVSGLEFHRFYFEDRGHGASSDRAKQSSMTSPSVRLMGDSAVVTYVRLVQLYEDGRFVTTAAEETRVWERQDGITWRHVHFHRSKPGDLE
jgi:ketosteroid isomerase-like protein